MPEEVGELTHEILESVLSEHMNHRPEKAAEYLNMVSNMVTQAIFFRNEVLMEQLFATIEQFVKLTVPTTQAGSELRLLSAMIKFARTFANPDKRGEILRSPNVIKIFDVLNRGRAVTANELSAQCGLSENTVREELARLQHFGLANTFRRGFEETFVPSEIATQYQ